MTTSNITAPAAMAGSAASALTKSMNGNVLLGLFVTYPIIRLFGGGLQVLVLGMIALAMLIMIVRSDAMLRTLWFAPLILLTAAAWLGSVGSSEGIPTYYIFLCFFFIILPTLGGVTFIYAEKWRQRIMLVFCAVALLFAVVPPLSDLAASRFATEDTELFEGDQGDDDNVRGALSIVSERAASIFVHPNEFGLFAGALLLLLGNIHRRDRIRDWPLADKVIAGLFLLFVTLSGSITGNFLVALAIGYRVVNTKLIILGTLFLFVFLYTSQISYATEMTHLLEKGSVYWRYLAAESIVGQAPWIGFAPRDLLYFSIWPHSIFLDFIFLGGKAGPMLLMLVVLFYCVRGTTPFIGGGILAFFSCAALQPAGAMPSCFILLALAIHSVPRRVTAPLEPSRSLPAAA